MCASKCLSSLCTCHTKEILWCGLGTMHLILLDLTKNNKLFFYQNLVIWWLILFLFILEIVEVSVYWWSLWKTTRSFHTLLIIWILSNSSFELWSSTTIIKPDIKVKIKYVVCKPLNWLNYSFGIKNYDGRAKNVNIRRFYATPHDIVKLKQKDSHHIKQDNGRFNGPRLESGSTRRKKLVLQKMKLITLGLCQGAGILWEFFPKIVRSGCQRSWSRILGTGGYEGSGGPRPAASFLLLVLVLDFETLRLLVCCCWSFHCSSLFNHAAALGGWGGACSYSLGSLMWMILLSKVLVDTFLELELFRSVTVLWSTYFALLEL